MRAIDLPAAASGVNRPHVGKFRRTAVSASYFIFGSERYMLTEDNRALREILSQAPYEFIEILANEKQYGGGGIYNFQATASVDTAFADYLFVHEFGHHFAGLADEYYMSPTVTTEFPKDRPEPWEPNVTALRDPGEAQVARSRRWRHAFTDAVGQGGLGGKGARVPQPSSRVDRAEGARVRVRRALPRAAVVRYADASDR